MGSSHEVKEGSYTTTLKVYLAAPGLDIGIAEPLGADGEAKPINSDAPPEK